MRNDINYSKGMSAIRKASGMSFCFNKIEGECSSKIVSSHGIQENGKLSLIESEYEGNNSILTFEKNQKHKRLENLPMPKPQGKGSTSTFKGFCKKHDLEIFKKIENLNYENKEEINFKHSYRSFAYSYHYIKRMNKAFNDENIGKNLTLKYKRQLQAINNKLSLFEKRKDILNNSLNRTLYDSLEYFVFQSDFLPIASCSTIHLQYNFENIKLTGFPNTSDLIITSFPEKERHITIIAGFKDNKTSHELINTLKELEKSEVELLISSFWINYTNSTYISPIIWKQLGLDGQKTIMEQIVTCFGLQQIDPSLKTGFNKSKINLFNVWEENKYCH